MLHSYFAEVTHFDSKVMDNKYYEKALSKALDGPEYFPECCSKILDFLYLGGESEAQNCDMVREHGFTHVINCAACHCATGPSYYGGDIKYTEFDADDSEGYDMMKHFEDAYKVIEEARNSGGKVLLHCIIGVNRSGLLAAAYCMVHKNMDPISAAVFVKKSRGCLLTNDSFQRQLVAFVRQRNLLPQVKCPKEIAYSQVKMQKK